MSVAEQSIKQLFNGYTDTSSWADVMIDDICIDSRQASAGALFLALPGQTVDGRDFVASALENGAAAAVVQSPFDVDTELPVYQIDDLKRKAGAIADRFFAHPSRKLCVVGVTGTNGKTTCCHLMAQALQEVGATCGVLGTLGNGLIDDLDQANLTTGDVVSVHRELNRLLQSGAEFVCMEASSHALDQGRVDRIAFDVAVFTNLSQDHLDYHGSMQSYSEAKARLFQWPDLTACVVNIDDPFGKSLAASLNEDSLWTYGTTEGARVRLQKLDLKSDGLVLTVAVDSSVVEINVPLMGSFNAMNVLAVLTTLLSMGFAATRIAAAMSKLKPVRGRLEWVSAENGPRAVVDYAHTPDALQQALQAVRGQCQGELWVVFGCGGDRDKAKRAPMGRIATEMADHVVLTNDNPRFENPESIVLEIRKGCDGSEQVILDRAEAIAYAVRHAARGDLILIAGKGHETYQIVGDKTLSMDDRQLASQALEGVH